jgi:predicted O-methyltransferase YrrM
MSKQETKFLSGLIRRYKPKKILEVGVYNGGSSAIILNSIKDDKDAKLYSVDLDGGDWVGHVVKENFPHLAQGDKWKLFKGNVVAKYLDEIGSGIDFVFLDTMHLNPGEILDFLMILPYLDLKKGAVIVMHDTLLQKDLKSRWGVPFHQDFARVYLDVTTEVSPPVEFGLPLFATNCTLLATIRGKKLTPSYDAPNIGAVQLEEDQSKYLWDYFRLLTLPWVYIPEDDQLKIMEEFFMKHYNQKLVDMFKGEVIYHKAIFAKADELKRRIER